MMLLSVCFRFYLLPLLFVFDALRRWDPAPERGSTVAGMLDLCPNKARGCNASWGGKGSRDRFSRVPPRRASKTWIGGKRCAAFVERECDREIRGVI